MIKKLAPSAPRVRPSTKKKPKRAETPTQNELTSSKSAKIAPQVNSFRSQKRSLKTELKPSEKHKTSMQINRSKATLLLNYSITHLCNYAITQLLITQLRNYSITQSLNYSIPHLRNYSITRLLICPITQLFNYPITQSSIIQLLNNSIT